MSDIVFESEIEDAREEDISALEKEEKKEEREEKRQDRDSWKAQLANPYKFRLEYSGEMFYSDVPEDAKPAKGSYAVINTKFGADTALCLGPVSSDIRPRKSDVFPFIRCATAEDMQKSASLKAKEEDALRVFKQKITLNRLDMMKGIAAHYVVGEPRIVFFFSSDERVDFRMLVKDLVSVFRMRVELRQIGVRDECRMKGGVGICGRPFCCMLFADRMRSVSIKMGKIQGLSLNSLKISGTCGRLLCCLAYEEDWYESERQHLPPQGTRIQYRDTTYRVSALLLTRSMVRIEDADGDELDIAGSRFRFEGGQWLID